LCVNKELLLNQEYWNCCEQCNYRNRMYRLDINVDYVSKQSGFSVLEVACWPLVLKFAGLHPAETIGFLGQKNPEHAFLRRGSKNRRCHIVALQHVKDP
jgi:hypothetical protein